MLSIMENCEAYLLRSRYLRPYFAPYFLLPQLLNNMPDKLTQNMSALKCDDGDSAQIDMPLASKLNHVSPDSQEDLFPLQLVYCSVS
jgi:hypothetical protein